MGMRSYVSLYDVRIDNEAGLKQYVFDCLSGKAYGGKFKDNTIFNCVINQEWHINTGKERKFTMADDFVSGKIDFDDWKIISYWYDDFLILIRDLSSFFSGELHLEFETGEEFARIYFEDVTRIELGEVNWRDLVIEDNYGCVGGSSPYNNRDPGPIPEEADVVKRSRLLKQV